jgi:hypothetical protein
MRTPQKSFWFNRLAREEHVRPGEVPCIASGLRTGHDTGMSRSFFRVVAASTIGIGLLFPGIAPSVRAEAPSRAATAAFDAYLNKVEARLDHQHRSDSTFVAPKDLERLRSGVVLIEKLNSADGTHVPGAMLHHWRGTAFAPGATAADFERLMRNFNSYPQIYAPQVLRSTVETNDNDRYAVTMRVRQKHVLTVVMDTAYDVHFDRLDARHGWSSSRSTAIREIVDAGTSRERALNEADGHGFLWRLNTYWTYEERDGGLYLQIESVSLTRAIPTGLGWAIGPFVESVPRESLEFTLRQTCQALKHRPTSASGGSR